MHKIIKSGFGGGITAFIYFYLALYLDKFYNEKTANLISLIFSVILNFIVQYNIFLSKTSNVNYSHFYKFIFINIVNLGINQTIFDYLIDNKEKYINLIPVKFQKYYTTIVRMIINSLIFLLIAYPARIYWIFK